MSTRHDKAWLHAAAKEIAKGLKVGSTSRQLRARLPGRLSKTDTGGWSVAIGRVGRSNTRIEVWFDLFSGHAKRKLYAGFYSEDPGHIAKLAKRASRRYPWVRKIASSDIGDGKISALSKKLSSGEFEKPLFEHYDSGHSFFGFYGRSSKAVKQFTVQAIAFFGDVALTFPGASDQSHARDDYAKYENRTRVRSHLSRERSSLLATQRKIKDGYVCQICDDRMVDRYGEIGEDFAESHHIVPLGKLKGRTKTRLEDLLTVCANCHRMLHRMDGEKGDIEKLRVIVRRHRRKQAEKRTS